MEIVGHTVQARPADLDAQLLAATGCSAVEFAAFMANPASPGQVAIALAPFIEGASAPELAVAIEAAGFHTVAAEVLALYADAPAPESGE